MKEEEGFFFKKKVNFLSGLVLKIKEFIYMVILYDFDVVNVRGNIFGLFFSIGVEISDEVR